MGELLMTLVESIPPFRRAIARLRTPTLHAAPPSHPNDVVIYAVWGKIVIVTISLGEVAGPSTEITIDGRGGLPGKAAAAVSDLRRSIEIHTGPAAQ